MPLTAHIYADDWTQGYSSSSSSLRLPWTGEPVVGTRSTRTGESLVVTIFGSLKAVAVLGSPYLRAPPSVKEPSKWQGPPPIARLPLQTHPSPTLNKRRIGWGQPLLVEVRPCSAAD